MGPTRAPSNSAVNRSDSRERNERSLLPTKESHATNQEGHLPGREPDATDPALFRDLPEHAFLLGTDRFMGDPVGDAGAPSWQVSAFRMLLECPYAKEGFKDLLARGSLPGQLYGLCGLYFTDHEAFRVAVESYAVMDEGIYACLSGCIIDRVPVRQIVWVDGPGVVRLTGPEESI